MFELRIDFGRLPTHELIQKLFNSTPIHFCLSSFQFFILYGYNSIVWIRFKGTLPFNKTTFILNSKRIKPNVYFYKKETFQMSNEEDNLKNFTVIQSTDDWNNFLERVSNILIFVIISSVQLPKSNGHFEFVKILSGPLKVARSYSWIIVTTGNNKRKLNDFCLIESLIIWGLMWEYGREPAHMVTILPFTNSKLLNHRVYSTFELWLLHSGIFSRGA